MAKIVVQTAPFQNPKWPAGKLKPGQKAKLTVEAPKIKGSQHVEFRIRSGSGLVDTISSAAGKAEAEWVVPNLPHAPKLIFDALLRETPTPANGHRAVLERVESPEAEVAGYKVEITKIDTAFVPKTEKIEVTWKVTDAESAAKNGRVEIWGERYPSNLPVYTENFTPAAGSKEWKTWDGKANAGVLSGEYITPEFAPYRIRVVIGPDQASVEKPYEAGLSKATAAESAFEIIVESLWLRVQSSLTESATDDEYKFADVLTVEPRNPDGSYAATGRLPKEGEHGRIRLPMARHNQNTDSLSQGGLQIGDPYNSGATKCFDNTMTYKLGASELTVYLNRTKLESTTSDDDLSKGRKDYKEIDDHTIKLRPKFAKQKDILWIVRKDTTASGGDAVAKWESYPPGVNCHLHYGGIRGKEPNNLFLKDYAAGTGSEPVIGLASAFPWKDADLVNLKPDPVDADKQERVEVTAIQKPGDAKRGLAGVLFSPSSIAGDSYELKCYLDRCPFERNLGCVSEEKPKWEGKTGDLTVWRWIRILKSFRLPTTGQASLPMGVGSAADPTGRTYHADGVNMSVSGINSMQQLCFNEWTMKAATSGDVHENINLTDYITAHDNARPNSDKGKVTIATISNIKNYMGQYDHYRVQ